MSKLREDNVFIELIEKFPWLNNPKHRVGDLTQHFNELKEFNKKLGLELSRYPSFSVFDESVLDMWQDSFIEISFRYTPQGAPVLVAVFQPDNHTLIFASITRHATHKKIALYLEVHVPSPKAFTDLLVSLEHCVLGDREASVGFLS